MKSISLRGSKKKKGGPGKSKFFNNRNLEEEKDDEDVPSQTFTDNDSDYEEPNLKIQIKRENYSTLLRKDLQNTNTDNLDDDNDD